MSASLRDLNRRADALTPPSFDIDDIVASGDKQIGRRRVALATGTAALVAAVVAASTTFTGPSKQTNPPLDGPTPSATETSSTETSAPTSATRRLTYADVSGEQAPNWRIQSIQYGDQTLRLGVVLHMDVTDDGLAVLAEDGTIYFSDGSSVERIGQTSIEVSFSDADVKAASAGSLLAWFGPADRGRSLVVYDTHEHRVVAQVPVTDCVPGQCRLVTVVGNRVYWSESDSAPTGQPLRALDVSTSTVSETDAAGLSAYLRGLPRGFVKGDSYADGDVATQDVNPEGVFFAPVGSSLELRRLVRETSDEAIYAYGGYDTIGRRLHLRLPSGYTPAASDYTLFQWIDDDRFAVMAGAAHNEFGWNGFPGYGDILVCDISRERCTLAAKGPSDDDYRIVPHLDVPN